MRCVRRRGELSGVLPLRLMAPGARGPVPEPGARFRPGSRTHPVPDSRFPVPDLLRVYRMRLYNTLSRQEEEFAPQRDGVVRMYACGLTVYARGHIGNFRTFLAVDLLRRTLRHVAGFTVHHVTNFTDVDDKTIAESQKAGVPLREYTTRFIDAFREDAAALGLEPPEDTPRATDQENLVAMADMIASLEQRGHTYRSDGSIYFKISTLPRYGQLARLDQSGMISGARVDSDKYEKEDARDFVLWKADQGRRADLGLRRRPRPPRLAHRVLGDGAAPARARTDRHPLRRRRPDLPAPRERDRPGRRRDRPAVLAVLVPRRAPAHGRRREDVEVGGQRLHDPRHPRRRAIARRRCGTC